jgi:hypothetical protein
MQKVILAARNALSVGAAIAEPGHGAPVNASDHSRPYDHTANDLGGRYIGGSGNG